jgi:hypothetical protein
LDQSIALTVSLTSFSKLIFQVVDIGYDVEKDLRTSFAFGVLVWQSVVFVCILPSAEVV